MSLYGIRQSIAAKIVMFALLLIPQFAPQDLRAETTLTAIQLAAFGVNTTQAQSPWALVLNSKDAKIYQQIFSLQENGNWPKADKLIARLTDRSLLGHVMAQRYLHPTKYRSKYKELKDWMAKYADHPQAQRIYKLALKRRPKNWNYPAKPERLTGGGVEAARQSVERKRPPKPPRKALTRSQAREIRSIDRQIRRQIRKGWTLAVKRQLQSKRLKQLMPQVDYDRAAVRLGAGYFFAGRDEWAYEWTSKAARRSGRFVPEAYWFAGLAAWRMGDYVRAANHFEDLANLDYLGDWMTSAANFWAARSNLILRRPDRVGFLLSRAGEKPKTFYGVLALRLLGQPLGLRWDLPEVADQVIRDIAKDGHGRRAMALMQVGQQTLAEREIRLLVAGAKPEQAMGVLALVSQTGMSSLALRLHDRLYPSGDGLPIAAYPVPVWTPKSGFQVDRALIFALIRQESRFNPRAKSYAGARGLMQLMPSTASFIARDRKYKRSRYPYLFQPELNIELGQKYIEHLLEEDRVDGDLFRMTAAWNGGPGNLRKWYRDWQEKQKSEKLEDPLIFLESIPLYETRDFVERVLTNFWIYRDRFGQPTPSLDAIAAGQWPTYVPLDDKTVAANSDEPN